MVDGNWVLHTRCRAAFVRFSLASLRRDNKKYGRKFPEWKDRSIRWLGYSRAWQLNQHFSDLKNVFEARLKPFVVAQKFTRTSERYRSSRYRHSALHPLHLSAALPTRGNIRFWTTIRRPFRGKRTKVLLVHR